jgi:pectinesterase
VQKKLRACLSLTLALLVCRVCSAENKEITVCPDGCGDFKTVQEAIAAVPDRSASRTVIRLSPGVYHGQIVVPQSKSKVTFAGGDATQTILTYSRNVNEPDPNAENNRYRGCGVVVLADDCRAENVTFENTSGDHGQAMALRVDGDQASFQNCRLLGWQDTLLVTAGGNIFAIASSRDASISFTALRRRYLINAKSAARMVGILRRRARPNCIR